MLRIVMSEGPDIVVEDVWPALRAKYPDDSEEQIDRRFETIMLRLFPNVSVDLIRAALLERSKSAYCTCNQATTTED
jgi:hypothetical protein